MDGEPHFVLGNLALHVVQKHTGHFFDHIQVEVAKYVMSFSSISDRRYARSYMPQ